METLIILGKYILATALLLLFYWVVLRHRASYRLRRLYLMLVPLLGLMGFMHFNVTVTDWSENDVVGRNPLSPIVVHYAPESGALADVNPQEETTSTDRSDLPSPISIEKTIIIRPETESDSLDDFVTFLLDKVMPLVSVLLLLFGLMQVAKMLALKAKLPCTRTAEGYGLIRSAEVVTPFSFGRTIFLSLDMEPECEEMVLMHEKAHIAHGHYREVWGINLLICFLWFNPIVWLCRNELLKVHEFEADHDVLGHGIDKYDYQVSLLQMSVNVSCPVVSGFSQPLIHQRFVEMKSSVAGTLSALGKVGLLAWVAGLFGVFAFYACQVTKVRPEGESAAPAELFATFDAAPRLEKPETFTFEYICDSLNTDTVLYIFLSDDFFHFSNPIPAETLHVKDGKMTFQLELDHVIGMKWHLLPDKDLGFELFCSPGDTVRYLAKRDENTQYRMWSSEESQTYRDNVDKYILEFRNITQCQSPHMPQFDCIHWADPTDEQSLSWSNISRQEEKLYAVKNVYFTDTATIVQVMPRFDFVVHGFHFNDETCTCLIDDQGNKYKYIKTIYPSYHLDATVFGTYGVFEPIYPNGIRAFSLMGPKPTVFTTIKNIRPRKEDKWYVLSQIPWNKVCETFKSKSGVSYVELTDSVQYVSELGVSVAEGKDEKVRYAERLEISNLDVAVSLYEMVWKEPLENLAKGFKSSHCVMMNDQVERVIFEIAEDTYLFTYSQSVAVPSSNSLDSCKVIINGKVHPELKTKQQAKEYIKSLKLSNWSSSYWTQRIINSRDTIYEPTFEITFK